KRARQPVSAAPSSVVLSEPAGQPLPARVVLLSAEDDREVKIERVESDHAAIDCRWAQGPGRRATLKIRVDRTRIAGDRFRGTVALRFPGTVHVHRSEPVSQTLTIPVSCLLH